MPETINSTSYIIKQIEIAGSKIFFSEGKLQIKPAITKTHPELLEIVKENKSMIITFLIKKWTNQKDIHELLQMPVIWIESLPLQPILEIQIPGINENVFFDFRKKPSMDSRFGIVFDSQDIKQLIKYYDSRSLNNEKILVWCKRKKAKNNCNIPICVDKLATITNVSLEMILLPMMAKLVSIRLED